MDVGERLRILRQSKGLSQRELAKRAGVTNSTISMIEKNNVSPSISSLEKVLQGIPVTLAEFFDPNGMASKNQVVVYRPRDFLEIGAPGVERRLVGKAFSQQPRALHFTINRLSPGQDSGELLLMHTGQEAGYVIQGELHLQVDGVLFHLVAGDGYYFATHLPHRFYNQSQQLCEYISAGTPVS